MSLKTKVDKELILLKEELSKLNSYTQEIGKAKKATKKAAQLSIDISELIKKISDSYTDEVEELKKTRSELKSLSTELSKTNETIQGVDFPNRLDKIDNSVSSINMGIQNIHSGLNNLQSSLQQEIKLSESNIITKSDLLMTEKLKPIKNLSIIGIILSLILIAIVLILNFSK